MSKLTRIQKALQVLTEPEPDEKNKPEPTWWIMLSACLITLKDIQGAWEIIHTICHNSRKYPIFRRHIRRSIAASLSVGTDGGKNTGNFFAGCLSAVALVFMTVKLILDIHASKVGFFSAVFFIIAIVMVFGVSKHNWKQTGTALRRAINNMFVMMKSGELDALEQSRSVTIELFANKILAEKAANEKAAKEAAEATKRKEEAEKAAKDAADHADEDAKQKAEAKKIAQAFIIAMQQMAATEQSPQQPPTSTPPPAAQPAPAPNPAP